MTGIFCSSFKSQPRKNAMSAIKRYILNHSRAITKVWIINCTVMFQAYKNSSSVLYTHGGSLQRLTTKKSPTSKDNFNDTGTINQSFQSSQSYQHCQNCRKSWGNSSFPIGQDPSLHQASGKLHILGELPLPNLKVLEEGVNSTATTQMLKITWKYYVIQNHSHCVFTEKW